MFIPTAAIFVAFYYSIACWSVVFSGGFRIYFSVMEDER